MPKILWNGDDMAELWMPGAERQPESGGGSMAGGPPRAIWHVTWDELGKGGKMPSFNAISNYLKSVDYCPHLMWDPWTGRIVQFYPADKSARALRNMSGGVETNRMGSRCIQVEVFFSPGAVVDGKRYDTVAETPCKGLDQIVAWMRTHGIPDVWPLGWPKWSGNSRTASTWKAKAGHYGHCHVPENSHTDPGPMPAEMFAARKPPTAPPWPGRILVARTPEMHGDDVLAWQRQMNKRGWSITPDGFYKPADATICGKFQQDSTAHDWPLDDDGMVGEHTWKAAFERPVT
jgi:hypothetical protein